MGYDLHITRNTEPSEDDFDGGIDFDEWKTYVEGDPSLRLDGYAEAHGPNGETLRVTDDGIAVWTDHPTANGEHGWAWLHFRSGEICVKSPDQEFLAKMLSIAADLNAFVVGDDGELYERPDDHGVLPAETLAPKPASKPWWQFW
ncbi:hypothetical protein [Rubripirellula reticaptiva]|uniref:Uncharacterized protein n=1 Tax=Rubripirellula reticaptiva TaxID=2528013 RepID=A0A5C6EVE7_9BACT|nr:hypothetical protein [Rubripirellula reticaptiva]TWU51449.1 hypothetical protein Poly59_30410 [Rubripirellula reticaptiva]